MCVSGRLNTAQVCSAAVCPFLASQAVTWLHYGLEAISSTCSPLSLPGPGCFARKRTELQTTATVKQHVYMCVSALELADTALCLAYFV